MSTSSRKPSAVRVARLGLLAAMAIALSALEGVLPPLPSPIPLRYGLANVAVMATLLVIGPKASVAVALMKTCFVLITRGAMAGLVSLVGTVLALVVMIALYRATRGRISLVLLSVSGAIAHNAGQFLLIWALYGVPIAPWAIGGPLLAFGVATGLLSAALLSATVPALTRAFGATAPSKGKEENNDA